MHAGFRRLLELSAARLVDLGDLLLGQAQAL